MAEVVVDDHVVVGLFLRFTEEGGEVGEGVFSSGKGHLSEIGEGGHEVVVGAEMVGFGSGGDLAGPADDEGALHAALVTGALESGAAGAAIEDVALLGSAPFFVGEVGFLAVGEDLFFVGRFGTIIELVAVVGGEGDDGVLVEALGFEFLHDEADVVIEHLDHGGIFFLGVAERRMIGVVGVNFRNGDGAVGELGGVVEEEGLVLVIADELEDTFDEDVLRVGFATEGRGLVSQFGGAPAVGVRVSWEIEALAITPEIGRVESVAADVIIVALVEVPAVTADFFVPGEEAVVELAELGGFVAGFLSDLSEEDFVIGDGEGLGFEFGELGLVFGFGDLSRVALDGKAAARLAPAALAAVVHASEEGPAGGGTEDGAVVVGKFHAVVSEAIDVGCLDEFLAVGADHADAEVIGKDKDDVGLGCGLGRDKREEEPQQD